MVLGLRRRRHPSPGDEGTVRLGTYEVRAALRAERGDPKVADEREPKAAADRVPLLAHCLITAGKRDARSRRSS